MKEYFKVRNPHYCITSLKTTNISNMNIERLIKAIEVSNLPEEDKRTLTKLLKQNRKEEFIKLILKIIGIGSVFWD
jgi:hypothetical protein